VSKFVKVMPEYSGLFFPDTVSCDVHRVTRREITSVSKMWVG